MFVKVPQPYQVGFFNSRLARPGMRQTEEHRIYRYEIEFCNMDGGTTYIDGKAYPVCKNMIICAKPGQIRWTQLPFCCYYIQLMDGEGWIYDTLQEVRDCWITPPGVMDSFLQTFHQLSFYSGEQGSLSGMRYYSALLALLSDVAWDSKQAEFRKNVQSTGGKVSEAAQAVQVAKEYMDTHFYEKCSLDMVAKRAGFSPIYFHRLFKDSVGVSPNTYLLRRRLTEAQERLTTGDQSLSEIAFACGFGSQSYFQYVFRREFGMTPANYRKSQLQKYLDE